MKLRTILDRLKGGRTSLADRDDYVGFCARASRDPAVFARFKRDPDYTRILEHTTQAQGRAYLDIVRSRYAHLLERLDRFARNDRHGDPVTYEYGALGAWSPTTLRYIKVLGDLEAHFGDLATMDVIEIGGGYGGQCVIVDAYGGAASYTLVDLAPCLELAGRYLEACGVEGVERLTMEALPAVASYDLVISNYAWSECTRAVQETYFERVLGRSARGYLTCNEVNPERFGSFGREELLARLPASARVLPEEPLTHARNFVVVWGDGPEAAG